MDAAWNGLSGKFVALHQQNISAKPYAIKVLQYLFFQTKVSHFQYGCQPYIPTYL